MKYEEVFLEIKYFKPNLDGSNQFPKSHIEAAKKIATYKLSL